MAGSVCGRKVVWKEGYVEEKLYFEEVMWRGCEGKGMWRGGFVEGRVCGGDSMWKGGY